MDKKSPNSQAQGQRPSPPPSYGNPPDLTKAFDNLNLTENNPLPTPSQCIAHLKLLESFFQLRKYVGTNDGLFGLKNDFATTQAPTDSNEKLIKIREKRWAVYVTKAAMRFQTWWQTCIQPASQMLQQTAIGSASTTAFGPVPPLKCTTDNLPPLGKSVEAPVKPHANFK